MAEQMISSSTLRIGYDAGLNEKGETIIKRKSYSNVKPEAAASQLYEAAGAISSLQELPVVEVSRLDTAAITG